MAVQATAIYRIRKSGSDSNGGGFDPGISGAISTTLSAPLTSGGTSMSLTSLTNLPTSGTYYLHIGPTGAETTAGASEVVQVTGAASNPLTIARGQLGTSAQAWASLTNVDNECTRCDTNIAGTSTGANASNSTIFTDASGSFNTAMVGLALWVASATSGTPIVAAYYITAVASATSVTIDRTANSSSALTGVTYKVGGAWANIQVNWAAGNTSVVAGNTIYVRGSGSDNPGSSSPDYTHANATTSGGATGTGYINLTGEFGRPSLKGTVNTVFSPAATTRVSNLWFIGSVTGSTAVIVSSGAYFYNCVFDQNGFDQTLLTGGGQVVYCEFFNSGSAPAAANAAVNMNSSTAEFLFNNFHDVTSTGIINTSSSILVYGNIFSKCGSDVLLFNTSRGASTIGIIMNNTFDGGAGNGILFSTSAAAIFSLTIINNIFSNFTGVSKAGIANSGLTQATLDRVKGLIDYNTFYNNTANYTSFTAGPNDTNLSVNPYVGQSTENFTLATGLLNGVGFPVSAFLQHLSGKTTTVVSYNEPGAVDPLPRRLDILSGR